MASPTYPEQIRAALAIDESDEAIRRVKGAVAGEFSHLDRRVKVAPTDYFNHSWFPDLVLQWPHQGVSAQRYVYLRFPLSREETTDDIAMVSRSHPILFELANPEADAPEGVEDRAQEQLLALSREEDTLVTNADALQVFTQARGEAPVVSLLSGAILQGGRGLVEEEEATRVAYNIVSGFEGARRTEREATERGAVTTSEVLNAEYARRVNRFLEAVWVGSGGERSEFPGGIDLRGEIDDDGLQFLLEFEPIEDWEFWRSVGHSVTTEQLGRLRISGYSENLQYLVKACLDGLSAKICTLLEDQPRLDELPVFYWTIERGLLALRGIDITAYVATMADEMTVRSPERDGVSLQTLLGRANRHGIKVTDLELYRGDKTLAYRSESATDVIHDRELDHFAEAFGRAARVRSATTQLDGSRDLLVDFAWDTARGRTVARFPVDDLVRRSLMLLRDLGEQDLAALEHAVPAKSFESPELRLDLDEGPE